MSNDTSVTIGDTTAMVSEQPQYVDWAAGLADGIVVELNIKRYRGVTTLDLTSLGLSSRVEKEMGRYMMPGQKRLLPPKLDATLKTIETQARNNLHVHSFSCDPFGSRGKFVPIAAYSDFRLKNAQYQRKFYEIRDQIAENYDGVIAQVRDDYAELVAKMYKQEHGDNIEQKTLDKLVHSIIAQIPSRDDLVSSFEYVTSLRRMPQHVMEVANTCDGDFRIASIVPTNPPLVCLGDSKNKVDVDTARRQLERDLQASLNESTDIVTAKFLTASAISLRKTAIDGGTRIIESIEKNDNNMLVGRASIKAHNLVSLLRALDYYGDCDMEEAVDWLSYELDVRGKRSIPEIKIAAKAMVEWATASVDFLEGKTDEMPASVANQREAVTKGRGGHHKGRLIAIQDADEIVIPKPTHDDIRDGITKNTDSDGMRANQKTRAVPDTTVTVPKPSARKRKRPNADAIVQSITRERNRTAVARKGTVQEPPIAQESPTTDGIENAVMTPQAPIGQEASVGIATARDTDGMMPNAMMQAVPTGDSMLTASEQTVTNDITDDEEVPARRESTQVEAMRDVPRQDETTIIKPQRMSRITHATSKSMRTITDHTEVSGANAVPKVMTPAMTVRQTGTDRPDRESDTDVMTSTGESVNATLHESSTQTRDTRVTGRRTTQMTERQQGNRRSNARTSSSTKAGRKVNAPANPVTELLTSPDANTDGLTIDTGDAVMVSDADNERPVTGDKRSIAASGDRFRPKTSADNHLESKETVTKGKAKASAPTKVRSHAKAPEKEPTGRKQGKSKRTITIPTARMQDRHVRNRDEDDT